MSRTKRCHSSTPLRTLLSEIYLGLGGSRSEHLAKLVQNNDRASDVAISKMELPDPNSYGPDDWRAFFRDYCVASLASKLDCLDTGVDRSAVAVDKFLLCERHCYEMNVKFSHPDRDPFLDPRVSKVFHLARRKIGRVLGCFDWDEAVSMAAFGPGAAVGVPRRRSHVVDKFGLERPTVTGECATLAEILIGMSPQWSKTVPVTSGRSEDCFEIVRGSRITTVPKNAKTDRVIAIEPLMNMFFQKGIGATVRRRLRTVGVNLDDQSRNQRLARKGSLDSSLATIDLASASDSVSRGLVEWLLPDEWVTAMKLCRSTHCVLPSGEYMFLQKFSSMGNGYTFELESLIFWAICSSVTLLVGESARDLGVYGDDLIVPSACTELAIMALNEAGFSTNLEKTFISGPFRESCGKHYFLGHDVTPLYIRKDVCDPERLLWLLNSIRRLAHRLVGYEYGCCASLEAAYLSVYQRVPRYCRKLSIPEGFGDGGVVRDFDESRPTRHRYFDAFVTRHVRRVYSSRPACDQRALTTSLFFLERRAMRETDPRDPFSASCLGDVSLEIPTSRYKLHVVKLVVDRWWGLGPWVVGFN